jgi:CCR4-NOT transcription complex subunit 2
MLNKTGPGQRPDQHGGGQDGPAFDASDFPSLTAAGGGGQHRSSDNSSETFAALLGSQQKGGMGVGMGGMGGMGGPGQQQQAAAAGPSFQEDDFPALPGSAAPASRQQQDGSEGAAQLQQLQQQLGSLAVGGGGGFGGLGGGYDLLRMQQQRQLQQQQAAAAALKGGPGAAAAAAAAAAGGKLGGAGAGGVSGAQPDRFGLLGLLSVIRMTDPDLTTLALGTDLTTLGLNLNSPEALWKTFASPWADGPGKPEPDFKVGGVSREQAAAGRQVRGPETICSRRVHVGKALQLCFELAHNPPCPRVPPAGPRLLPAQPSAPAGRLLCQIPARHAFLHLLWHAGG